MSIGSTNFNPVERAGSTNISEGSNVSSRENSATGASKHLLGRFLSRAISKERKINTNSSMDEIKRRLAEVKNEIANSKKQGSPTEDLEKKLELLNSIRKVVGGTNKEQVLKELNTLRRLSGNESSASLVKDSVLLYMRKEYKDLEGEYVKNSFGVSSKISTMNSEIKNAMEAVKRGTFGKPTEVRMSQGGKQEVIKIPYKDSLHIEGFPDKESRMKALEEMKGSMETIGKCFDDLVKASPEEREKMIKTIEDLSKNTKYLVIQDVCEDFIKTANFLILLDGKD